MAEDSFFPLFMEAVSKIGSLNLVFDGGFKDAYLSFWHEFSGRSDTLPGFAVADGSCSSTTFRGGVRAVCVRALANVYEGRSLIESVSDVDVRVGHRLKRASLYMRALEFKCLKKAVDGFGKVDVAICDGDLYPTMHPVIVRRTSQEVEAFLEYLNSLYELYKHALERGVLLVGVVKDSFVNYLRARVLASHVLKENPELGEEVYRMRSVRNIEKKLSQKRGGIRQVEVLLREAQRLSSDEEILDEYASKPGFTTPLVLAPQPIYLSEETKAGTKTWRSSKIRRRLKSRSPPLRDVANIMDKLYSLPPVVMSYWRPWHGIGVYRVDVAGWGLGINIKWDEVEGDYFLSKGAAMQKFEEIAALLNGLSPEPFTVKPLLDVDDLVRFSAKTYKECYEPILIEALRRAGFKALLTKRDLRELMVRI